MAGRGLGTLTLDLAIRLAQFTGPLSKADRDLQKFHKRAEAFGRDVGKALKVGFGIGVAALGLYVKNTIEAEKVQAQLIARIKDTAGAAGRTLEQLNAQAAKLQGVTVFDDESIGEAQAALLTFGQVTGRVFDRTIEDAADLATVMGTDIADAARVLGKALSDPEKGIGALRKAGITLTGAQTELVVSLQKTGNVAAAQGVILDALEGKMGTAAEAARNTLGGALQGLQNSFNNLLEGDGSSAGVRDATDAINEFSATLDGPDARAGVDGMISGLAKLAGWVVDVASAFVKSGQQIGNTLGLLGDYASGLSDYTRAALSGDAAGAAAARTKFLGDYRRFVEETERTRGDFDAAAAPFAAADRYGGTVAGAPVNFQDPPPGARRPTTPFRPGGSGGGAPKKSDAEREAEQLEAAYRRMNAQLAESAALYGQTGEAAKVRYEVENGELAKLSEAKKADLIQGAELLDQLEADAELVKERNKLDEERLQVQLEAHEALAGVLSDMQFELDLMGKTNTQRVAEIELRRIGIGLSDEEREAARSKIEAQAEAIEQSREAVAAADDVRASFEDAFVNVFTEGVGAIDKFFKSLFQQLLLLEAKKLSTAIFGEQGTSGWLSALFGSGGGGGSVPAVSDFFASGTDFAPGGFAVVGERGPEVVNLPRGSQVIPNDKLGGHTFNITIANGTPKVAQQVANEVSRKLAFSMRGGR